MYRTIFRPLAAVIVLATQLAGCAAAPPAHFTQAPGRFTACPSAPHCVSSQAPPDSSHYVPPLRYRGDTASARHALLQVLRAQSNARIVRADDQFVHATFHTTLGFVDDVTFVIKPKGHRIDVKSESRIGYYDFGVNRRRVQHLRKAFETRLKNG